MRILKLIRLGLLVIVAVCFCQRVNNCDADLIWIKGQTEPVSGLILSSTENQLVIDALEIAGDSLKSKGQQIISKDRIEAVIRTIDTQRLEKLKPENPADYRDFAEELAAHKLDPIAIKLARRLFLLAAAISDANNNSKSHTEQSFQVSALTALISLTPSESERAKIRDLQFAIQPNSKRDSNVKTQTQREVTTPPTEDQNTLMVKLIRAIRMQDLELARSLLRSPLNRKTFAIWSSTCSLEQLDQISKRSRPDDSHLIPLLQIELSILESKQGGVPESQTSRKKLTWGDYSSQASTLSVVPSFANITEFNPSETIFRNGEWTSQRVSETQ